MRRISATTCPSHKLQATSHKPQADGATELSLSPLELIDRIAALVPPPRVHRHHYHGVLAPNSPLRARVTALAEETTVARRLVWL